MTAPTTTASAYATPDATTIARLCNIRRRLAEASHELNELTGADLMAEPVETRKPWAEATNQATEAADAVGRLIDHLS